MLKIEDAIEENINKLKSMAKIKLTKENEPQPLQNYVEIEVCTNVKNDEEDCLVDENGNRKNKVNKPILLTETTPYSYEIDENGEKMIVEIFRANSPLDFNLNEQVEEIYRKVDIEKNNTSVEDHNKRMGLGMSKVLLDRLNEIRKTFRG